MDMSPDLIPEPLVDLGLQVAQLTKDLAEANRKVDLLTIRLEAAVAQRNAEADKALVAMADAEGLKRKLQELQPTEGQPNP